MKKELILSILLFFTMLLVGCETVSSHSRYTRYGDTVYFGTYPQGEVTDTALISTLSTKAGTLPTEEDSYNWISYGYYIEGYVSNYMWYVDLEENDEKYRGVYFSSYRPRYIFSHSSADDSNQDENGYYTNTVYWFKYEPIKWQIFEEGNGKAFLLADLALDSQEYCALPTRARDEKTIYANNYEYSTIRKWLNETFYNTAFSKLEKKIILTTLVDNSLPSTGDSNNDYVCNNTKDKIFLLSYQEATVYYLTSDDSRIRNSTDYAKSQGCSPYSKKSSWWLRSPFNSGRNGAHYISSYGLVSDSLYSSDAFMTYIGVVPALRIIL